MRTSAYIMDDGNTVSEYLEFIVSYYAKELGVEGNIKTRHFDREEDAWDLVRSLQNFSTDYKDISIKRVEITRKERELAFP